MNSYVWGSLVAAAALVAGYLLNFFTARSTTRAASNQELERDRRIDRRERRAFQRQTLLEAQEWLPRVLLVVGSFHRHGVAAINLPRPTPPFPEELSQQLREMYIGFGTVAERVVDDKVRATLQAFIDVDHRLLSAKDRKSLDDGLAEMMRRAATATDVLGEALRAYLREDAP